MKCLRAKPSRRAAQAASTACRGPIGRCRTPCHVTRLASPQGLTTVTSHGLTSTTADASVQFTTSQATSSIDDKLRAWVSSNGGNIHSSLRLVDVASCGCRGVVATAPISFAEAAEQPVLIVPERLYLSSDVAREILRAADSRRTGFGLFRSKPEPLPGTVAVALALAVERARGEDSFWRPYVASLPIEVQCGWALNGSQLTSVLEELEARGMDGARGWADEARQARAGVERWARRAVEQYGKLLPVKVDVDDMVWAMSQVLSRSFGREPDVGLAPYIDLCNHRHGAAKPGGFVDEATGQAYACISASLYGKPTAMAVGDELFVSYSEAANPLQAFLNLGFVPPELLPNPTAGRHERTGSRAKALVSSV